MCVGSDRAAALSASELTMRPPPPRPRNDSPRPRSARGGRVAVRSRGVPAAASTDFGHLGVNAIFLQPHMGGIETYVRRLYPAILDARPDLRVSVFVNEMGRDLLLAEDWTGNVELVMHRFLGRRRARAITETALLGAVADRRGCDVLHSVALTAPVRTRAANVVTIADVTWLRQRGSVPALTRLLWRGLVVPVARRADRIIAHSRAARSEI